ncbi:Rrf2 family transcriptional regulator [Eleftheria terrae]|uniref:Rrf2 family transcriptional regulator n=1 Tax=Eleftheria terrae TaxID=1597781 RepID=UPI00263BC506|nr:Rrf2 family transcriptional regulator [Eleftheria terrae]WKB55397.1 Rrf2 family transcriptional regulator [Eleftheria terrae]
MKLTAFTDYCLRVLIYLAAQAPRRATIAAIAQAYGVSEHHLTKVVHFLGKEGWVATVRGKGGGLGLALPPTQVSIGEVVRRAEGPAVPAECFDRERGACAIAPACRLRQALREAVDAFHAVLDGYTLEDLMGSRQALVQLLFYESPLPAPRPVAAPPGRHATE